MTGLYQLHTFRWMMVFAFCLAAPVSGDEGKHVPDNKVTAAYSNYYGTQLGTVRFPVSCTLEARKKSKQGLALLHHMTYEGARAAFADAVKADPDCAMGYWGQAMTFIHPLWSDPPDDKEFRKGQELVKKAKSRGKKTEWEQAYISAVEAYYGEGRNANEKINLAAFEAQWEKVYRRFPIDHEAACFYALSYMATADPADKTYARQRRAADIAQKVLTQAPDHPGAHHYTIHAYDYSDLAEKALPVARSYGKIAPEVPHALHMPAHIFTRLGLWEESISMNKRSAAAALKHPVNGKISLHYLHAVDYLIYAYLQRGEDSKAKQVYEDLLTLKDPLQVHIASAYTLAAVPARLPLERHKWSDAALLKPRIPADYPWDSSPAMEAITHFGRAVGAAQSGNKQEASLSIDKLSDLHDQTAKISKYWAKQVEIYQLSASAWLMYREGKQDKALEIMKDAAKLEASTEKHPVTPASVLPANELLGDMLLDMGRYKEAYAEYENTLKRNFNRFNSLYGAGRAAESGGDKNKAAFYYRKLVEMTAADSERKRLKHARAFLAGREK
jgi:tetratricopeptide (TPR) repeat protein